jgi:tetratricopeptide (TPR) repeat protein
MAISRARIFIAALAPLALACGTAKEEVKDDEAPPPAAPPPPEVEAHALCGAVLAVDDAWARGTLEATRERFAQVEATNATDAVARFGARLAIEKENDSWQAFKADSEAHPDSVVRPLGECFVYARWKMADQAKGPCELASQRVDDLALVDVALGDLAAARKDYAAAVVAYDKALAVDGQCTPALLRKARAQRAAGDAKSAGATYLSALKQQSDCFVCAAERADLVEQSEGTSAARGEWERALQIAPDHAPTVQRYAASQVGADDGKALAAYEKAIALGVKDKATLLAASRLASKTGDAAKAVTHAQAAAKVYSDDVGILRLVVSLQDKKGDAAGADAANAKILELLPDDWQAHLALARSAKKGSRLVDALNHYDAATRALEGAGDDVSAEKVAANAELGTLLRELKIPDKGASGNVTRVVGVVQGRVRPLFEAAKKKQKGLKGMIEVVVVTEKDGSVKDVEISKDSLSDPKVAAALVGNLRRATIVGGAKRYSFELEFN